ncbi:MAG: hypothetical protein GX601_06685 [Anaerolineales bacterium]|nr:hypothetical protein [Anaerolineales bacterium]
MEIVVSERWRQAYPGAVVGVLAMRGVANPTQHAGLERRRVELEETLRVRYSGWDRAALKALPVLQAYDAYYRRFRKTYHVQLQLESVALKGKPIPSGAGLVATMFMAELRDLLLTAVHDLDAVEPPMCINVADGSERYVRMDGGDQELKASDMFIADARGILSSIIYGPDRRTSVVSETRAALFTTYAPPGVGPQAVRKHLMGICENVLVIAPEALVETLEVVVADG